MHWGLFIQFQAIMGLFIMTLTALQTQLFPFTEAAGFISAQLWICESATLMTTRLLKF